MTGRFDAPVGAMLRAAEDALAARSGRMTDLDLVAAAVAGIVCGGLGVLVPPLIARIPEPEPDPEPASEEPEEPEEPEEQGAVRRHRRCCPGSSGRPPWSVSSRGLRSARSSASTWPLLYLVPLVPIGVALAVVDWRTRLLPTLGDRADVPRSRRAGPRRHRDHRGTRTTWCAPRSAGWSPAVSISCCGSSTRAGWGTATCGCPASSASRSATSAGASWSSGIYGGFLLGGVIGRRPVAAQQGRPQGLPVRSVHAPGGPRGRRCGTADHRRHVLLKESPRDIALADRG